MTTAERIQQLDAVILACVSEKLPEFADAEVTARHESVSEKHIEAFLKFTRPVAGDLLDTIVFYRDYDEEYDCFIFNLDFGVMRPGQEDDLFPPVTELACVLYRQAPKHELLDWGIGAGWYLLGCTLKECEQRVAVVLQTYREFAMPVIAEKLMEYKETGPN